MRRIWSLLIPDNDSVGACGSDPRQSTPEQTATSTSRRRRKSTPGAPRCHENEIEMIEHSQVWQIAKSRDERGYIRDVTWSGSSIPPQTFAEFKLLVRNPTTPGTYLWKIEQSYQDGNVATWEAQTQIVPPASVGGTQRAEEAWRAAQVATTVSLVAIGVSITLVIVTAISIVQSGRSHGREGPP